MSLFIYAGSMQYVAPGLLTEGASVGGDDGGLGARVSVGGDVGGDVGALGGRASVGGDVGEARRVTPWSPTF